MINNANPFSQFSIGKIDNIQNRTTNIETNANTKGKTFQKKCLIPTIVGAGAGTTASIIKKKCLYNQAKKSISNFRIGAEAGFKTFSLYNKLNDLITTSKETIKKEQGIIEYVQDKETGIVYDNYEEIIKTKQEIIKRNSEAIDFFEGKLKELHTKIVETPVKEKTLEFMQDAKQQSKRFSTMCIITATAIGGYISTILYRINKEQGQ